jgi:predicted nucleotidyltransferase
MNTLPLLFTPSIDTKPIQPLVDLIIESWEPEQIWLFGSRAKGSPREDSDWDLLVITPNESNQTEDLREKEAWGFRRKTRINADILFCSAHEFEIYSSVPNTLTFEVAQTGVLIYDSRRTNSQANHHRKFSARGSGGS